MNNISLRKVGADEQRKRRYEEGEVPDFLETLRSERTQLGHDPTPCCGLANRESDRICVHFGLRFCFAGMTVFISRLRFAVVVTTVFDRALVLSISFPSAIGATFASPANTSAS
jgi:hypothetical protein